MSGLGDYEQQYQASLTRHLQGGMKRKAPGIMPSQNEDEDVLFAPNQEVLPTQLQGGIKRTCSGIRPSQKGEKEALFTPNGQMGPSKTPQPCASAQSQAAPSNNPTQGKEQDTIELSDDDDENGEVLVRFKYSTTNYPKIKKSAILPFVKKQSVEIFLRRSHEALNDGEEKILKKTADILIDYQKPNFSRLYREDWSRLLRRSVKAITDEVNDLRSLQDMLKWKYQEIAFARHILQPRELKLQQAEDDVKKMAALVEFLEKH